jgi:hypothetical protein
MNTIEILEKIKNDKILKNIFIGVFPANKVPQIKVLPSALILNLDTSDLPGSHWIALYFSENGKCDYFDSYGRQPPGIILSYISRNCHSYIYNNACVQELWTISCGQMCLYFLIWRVRGITFRSIVKSIMSDDFVKGFIDSL